MTATRETLLASTRSDQLEWLKATEPGYEGRAYEPDLVADIFYPHKTNWLDDLRETHGADLGEYLEGIEPPLGQTCIDRICGGGSPDAGEAQTIMSHIAEEDTEGWVSLVGWEADCDGSSVFVVCLGASEGQAGINLKLRQIFADRADAAKTFPAFAQG